MRKNITMTSRHFRNGWFLWQLIQWNLSNQESWINGVLHKVPIQEICSNLICINQTPVYCEHIWWSQGVLVWQVSLHYKLCMRLKDKHTNVKEEAYKRMSLGLDCIKSHNLTCCCNIYFKDFQKCLKSKIVVIFK